jgi:hypothetical protein
MISGSAPSELLSLFQEGNGRFWHTTPMSMSIPRLSLALAAFACAIGIPFAAQADIPSYAQGEESIHGKVSGFDGKYDLTVRDDRGFDDHVRLHDGTVINPTGLRLAGGMTVTVYGHNDGSVFSAAEIETPYHRSYAYGYPYPAYGPYYGPYYGPAYGPYYGPYFGARIGFGFR